MKKIIYGLMIMLIALSLIGCKKDNNKGNEKKEKITYSIIGLSNAEETYDEDSIGKLGLNYELTMSLVNNTATLKIGDYQLNLTYDKKEFIDNNSEDHMPYEKSGNRVTIDYNGEKMIFREK